MSRTVLWERPPMNYKTVMSVCPYCGCGCGLYLEVVDGHLVGTMPSNTHPISRGSLCIKGWSAHEFVESEDRLRRPLWKRGANLEATDWDTALYFVADRLKPIKDKKYSAVSKSVDSRLAPLYQRGRRRRSSLS